MMFQGSLNIALRNFQGCSISVSWKFYIVWHSSQLPKQREGLLLILHTLQSVSKKVHHKVLSGFCLISPATNMLQGWYIATLGLHLGKFQLARWSHEVAIFSDRTGRPPSHLATYVFFPIPNAQPSRKYVRCPSQYLFFCVVSPPKVVACLGFVLDSKQS